MNKVFVGITMIGAIVTGCIYAAGLDERTKSNTRKESLSPVEPIDGFQEYRNLLNEYKRLDSGINLSGTIAVYDSDKEFTLKESTRFSLQRSGRNYVYQLHYLQFVSNGSMTVQLDTVNKHILLLLDTTLEESYSSSAIPFENLIPDTSQFKLEMQATESGNQRTLKIQSDFNPEIRSTVINYSKKDYKIEGVEISWWKDGADKENVNSNNYWLSKINYSYKKAEYFNASAIINTIIQKGNTGMVPATRYKDYAISVSN